MPCKGICKRYKAKQIKHFKQKEKVIGSTGRYLNGQKYCATCLIFIKWDGILCPCCGIRLRNKTRSAKLKSIYRSLKNKELEIV